MRRGYIITTCLDEGKGNLVSYQGFSERFLGSNDDIWQNLLSTWQHTTTFVNRENNYNSRVKGTFLSNLFAHPMTTLCSLVSKIVLLKFTSLHKTFEDLFGITDKIRQLLSRPN